MTAVAWPHWRADVIEALAILVTLQPPGPMSWPGLTEAVHWLVDDTFWDQTSPSRHVGTIAARMRPTRSPTGGGPWWRFSTSSDPTHPTTTTSPTPDGRRSPRRQSVPTGS
jgi:hypothetical protein